MVTTDDEALWRRMWAFKDHGKSYAAAYERPHPPAFAGCMRVSAQTGACSRCRRLWDVSSCAEWPTGMQFARAMPPRFATPVGRFPPFAFRGLTAGVQCVRLGVPSNWGAVMQSTNATCTLNRGTSRAGGSGTPSSRLSTAKEFLATKDHCSEVYLEAAFEGTGWRPAERLPVAKELGETSLMFLVHPTFTDDDIARTVKIVAEVLADASGSRCLLGQV